MLRGMPRIDFPDDQSLLEYLAEVLRRSVSDPDGIEGATAQLIRRVT